MNNNYNPENNIKLSLEIVSQNSNDSMDEDDFQTSAKLLQLNQMGLSVEKVNTKKKRIIKKNTRVSSNNEDDLDEFAENFHENKIKFVNLNIQTSQNSQNSQNNKSTNYNNFEHCSDKNLQLTYKSLNLDNSNPNINDNNDKKYDIFNNSENKNIHQKSNSPDPKSKVNLMIESSFSPNKRKRKLVMEQKQKIRGRRGSTYAFEQKEEKNKEEKNKEEKIYRKDKYGTPICKKNKKKVKVTFKENFEIVTPIESFKKYNVIIGIPKGEKYINRLENCQCCLVF